MLKPTFATLCLTTILSACSSSGLPPNVRGVTHIDTGTDYVYLYERSTVGGACEGWNVLAISRPGDYYGGVRNVVCWKEEGGMLHVNKATGGTESAPADVMLDIGR